MVRGAALLLVVLCFAIKAAAQDVVDTTQHRSLAVEEFLEMLAERDNLSDEALSDISNNLMILLEDPVNLNDTMPDNLSRLPISEFQITSITDYIRNHGQMVTPYELQLVPGFDETLTAQLLPFIITTPIEKFRPTRRVFRSSILTRYKRVIEKQKGYRPSTTNGYLGSPDALLVKAKITATERVQIGFTAEKDAGEELFKGSNPNGFDFYSGYLAASRLGTIKQVVVGDFSANFGQGLTLATGYSLGKASLMTTPGKRQRAISPYSSTDENRFFRGLATTASLGKITITAFASRKYIDASLEIDTSGVDASIESIQATGSHATKTEMANKHNVLETAGGLNVVYNSKSVRVGASCFGLKSNKPFNANSKPYQLLDGDPSEILRFGVDFLYYHKKTTCFGEGSMDKNNAKAIMAGVSTSIATAFNAMIIGRNYANSYPSRFANGFEAGGEASGERGVCLALQFTPYKKWRVRTYADFFEFTWLRYRVSAPSNGVELSAVAEYTPTKTTALQFGFAQTKRPYDVTIDNLKVLEQTTRTKARIQLSFSPTPNITAKTRLETTWFETETANKENGTVILQDIAWHNSANNFSISGRIAYYKTDSWNSRLYVYESDVLHSFSVPAYYQSGVRYYLVLSQELFPGCKVWVKWATSQLFQENEVGSGLAAINGNSKNDFKVQIQLRF